MEGYKYLQSYIMVTVIQDMTVGFVKRWISKRSRTVDQMEAYLLSKQIVSLKNKFVKEGGFRENLFKQRLAKRFEE